MRNEREKKRDIHRERKRQGREKREREKERMAPTLRAGEQNPTTNGERTH